MKRILILMADYGYGHHSAANAISEALQEIHGQECVVEIINLLDDKRVPAFLRKDQANYDKIIQKMPDLYKLGYQVSDNPVVSDLIENAFTLLLFNVMRETIRSHQPDVIICTHPIYPAILSAIYAIEKRHIPLLTVVTDLGKVHKLWFNSASDLYLVPTQSVYDQAIDAGLPPEKVKITGIPVHPVLAKGKQDQPSLRMDLGWRPDLFTVLAVGSKRVEHLYDSLRVLNHSGLPLILVNIIPGQETGNADYVISSGAGDLAQDPIEVLEVVCHWLANGKALYNQRVQNARRSGYPQAAYDITELVWAMTKAPTAE